jgi:hypothetical protein
MAGAEHCRATSVGATEASCAGAIIIGRATGGRIIARAMADIADTTGFGIACAIIAAGTVVVTDIAVADAIGTAAAITAMAAADTTGAARATATATAIGEVADTAIDFLQGLGRGAVQTAPLFVCEGRPGAGECAHE